MENDKLHLDLKNDQTEQNNFVIQEYDEEEIRRQQEEIEDMRQTDSQNKEKRIQELINGLNEEPKIDQWIIDLFNQLKKGKNSEEYLQKFVEDTLKNIGATYDSEVIKDLVSEYCRKSIKESLDFHDSVEIFNEAIQSLKGDIEKHIQKSSYERIPLDKSHNIGRIILSSTFGKDFNLIGTSGSTGVYSVPGENVVYKLDTLKLANALEEGNTYCDSSKSDNKENELFQEMERYFPENSVLTPKNHEKTIDIDDELIKELGISNKDLPKNFTFLYTTTPLASEINNGGVGFNLGFGRGHMDKLMGKDFTERFNGEGVTQEELDEYFDKKFDEVINNIKRLGNDDKKIKELLTGLVKFSENNDIILDIYGTDNFTFYLDSSGNLKYHIIDPFMPGNLSKSRLQAHKGGEKITIDNIHARSYEHIMEKIKNYCE